MQDHSVNTSAVSIIPTLSAFVFEANTLTRDDITVQLVDTHFPHMRRLITQLDRCHGCAHLLSQPGSGSICRKASLVSGWPGITDNIGVIATCAKWMEAEELQD